MVHMVIGLKVLAKSLNCEDRSCYAGNPRASFFLRVLEWLLEIHGCKWIYTSPVYIVISPDESLGSLGYPLNALYSIP